MMALTRALTPAGISPTLVSVLALDPFLDERGVPVPALGIVYPFTANRDLSLVSLAVLWGAFKRMGCPVAQLPSSDSKWSLHRVCDPPVCAFSKEGGQTRWSSSKPTNPAKPDRR